MEVTVHGKMAHAAIPDSGVDAMQAAVKILNALYAQNAIYKTITSKVTGITHPYLNVGLIEGGTNTNVIPGRVTFKMDRRMIPEENPAELKPLCVNHHRHGSRHCGGQRGCQTQFAGTCHATLAGNKPLVDAIQKHGETVFGETIPALGTPLYTDVRLFCEAGIPGVIYGAGPRTVLESNAKRADENLVLEDCAAPPKYRTQLGRFVGLSSCRPYLQPKFIEN